MKTVDAVAARGGGGDVAAAGSSHGAAAGSWPHGKGDVAPRNTAAKRTADLVVGTKPPAKKRRHGPQAAPARPPAPMIPG